MSDITGTNQSDTIDGTVGDDTIDAGNGKDVVDGGAGSDTIDLGNGKDIVIEEINVNRDGVDYLDGNNGMDALIIKGTANQLALLSDAIAAFQIADKSIVFDFGQYLEDHGMDRCLFDVKAINIEEVQLELVANTGPVAEMDTDSVTEDDMPSVMGNVLTNDSDSDWKDEITVTLVEFGGYSVAPDADGELISGVYGDLLLKSDGSYTYTLKAIPLVQALAEGEMHDEVFTYTISDGNGGIDTATLTITVNGKNDDPIAADASEMVNEGDALIMGNLVAIDPDNGAMLTFSLQNPAPAGFVLNPDGSYQFDPTDPAYNHLAEGVPQDLIIDFNVNDGLGGMDSGVLTITVTGTNDDPVLDAIDPVAIDELVAFDFSAMATDADVGDMLTFSLAGAPAGATISSAGLFEWTPAEDQDGVYNFDVIVEDGNGGMDSQTIQITVNDVNEDPTLDPIAEQFLNEGQMLSVQAMAMDNDLVALVPNNLSYSLILAPLGATISAAGLIEWATGELDDGIYNFEVKVEDGLGGMATESFTVNVAEVNMDPAIDAIGAHMIDEGAMISIDVDATDGDFVLGLPNTLTFSFDTPPPITLMIDSVTGVITGTAPGVNADTDYSIAVRVEDGEGGFDIETFTLTVNALDIVGTEGDDLLYGTPQDDLIFGLGGNDEIIGGQGDDIIDGGAGTDTAVYTEKLLSAEARSFIMGGMNVSAVIAAVSLLNYDLFLTAGYINVQALVGADGNDKIVADTVTPNDTTSSSIELIDFNSDVYNLYNGVLVSTEVEVLDLLAPPAGDHLMVGGDNDSPDYYLFEGDTGNDVLVGGNNLSGSSYDVLGRDGNDVIVGGDNINGHHYELHGDGGHDILIGGDLYNNGTYFLRGGAGNDVLIAGSNSGSPSSELRYSLLGQDGDDTLETGAGDHYLDGGTGIDTAIFHSDVLNPTVRNHVESPYFNYNITPLVSLALNNEIMNYDFAVGTVGFKDGIQVNGINNGAMDGNDLIAADIDTPHSNTSSSIEIINFAGESYSLYNGVSSVADYDTATAAPGSNALIVGGTNDQGFWNYSLNGNSVISGNDILVGGDILQPLGAAGSIHLNGFDGGDVLIGGDNFGDHGYYLNAGAGKDVLQGGDLDGAAYELHGDAGSDYLIGGDNLGTGYYLLDGGAGDDVLIAGSASPGGTQTLRGGGGPSLFEENFFVIDLESSEGDHVILDFVDGQFDPSEPGESLDSLVFANAPDFFTIDDHSTVIDDGTNTTINYTPINVGDAAGSVTLIGITGGSGSLFSDLFDLASAIDIHIIQA